MRTTDTPVKITTSFGLNGDRNTIATDSSTTTDNAGTATFNRGFPPVTMQPVGAGGIPPSGKDMNGALFAISELSKWFNAGMAYTFDSVFAAAIGGYPKGAAVYNSTYDGYWMNTVDQNSNNPEVSGATLTGWVPADVRGVTAVSGLTASSVTLSTLQAAKPRIVLTGTLTANINLVLPAWLFAWTIVNNCTGNFSVIVKTLSGSGVTVPNGSTSKVIGDGTNITRDFGPLTMIDVVPVANGGTGSNTAAGAPFNLKNTASLAASSGWHRDSTTGLIIQMGNITRNTDINNVVFPRAFTTACIGIVMTKSENQEISSGTNFAAISKTTTGFIAYMRQDERACAYIAVGY